MFLVIYYRNLADGVVMTSSSSSNTGDRAPDLFKWALIPTIVVMIPYYVFQYGFENQTFDLIDALFSALLMLGFLSSVLYTPRILFDMLKEKKYISALGPLKLYLAVGTVIVLVGLGQKSVPIFKLLLKYIDIFFNNA